MALGSAVVVLPLAKHLLGPEGRQEIVILLEGSEYISVLHGSLGSALQLMATNILHCHQSEKYLWFFSFWVFDAVESYFSSFKSICASRASTEPFLGHSPQGLHCNSVRTGFLSMIIGVFLEGLGEMHGTRGHTWLAGGFLQPVHKWVGTHTSLALPLALACAGGESRRVQMA